MKKDFIRARPSKTFFYEIFSADMKQYTDQTLGADVACAAQKNYPLFYTDIYVGVDIDERGFKGDVPVNRNSNAIGIRADITKPLFQNNSLDLLVVTHTLSHLERSIHLPMIKRFINSIRPGGDFILNIKDRSGKMETKLDNILQGTFQAVEKTRYRNCVSRFYEKTFSQATGITEGTFTLSGTSLWGARLLKGISYLLSWAEYLPFLHLTGNRLYYRARSKICK